MSVFLLTVQQQRAIHVTAMRKNATKTRLTVLGSQLVIVLSIALPLSLRQWTDL
jgi:hypothetical protein